MLLYVDYSHLSIIWEKNISKPVSLSSDMSISHKSKSQAKGRVRDIKTPCFGLGGLELLMK